MIIDCHTHIFSQAIRNNRETFFDDPAFQFLYSSPSSKIAGVEELISSMDENHVDKAVTFGFPWKSSKVFSRENDYLIESIHKYPDRLIGFCCFDPFSSNAVSETIRCLENGCLGVGELAFYQTGIDDSCLEKLTPIMEICADKKVPVMIHTNEPIGHKYPGKSPITLEQIYNLIKRFPQNILILAHWGGGIFFYRLLKKEVKETMKNCYFDTAASPFLYDPLIYRITFELQVGDKILFGSDYPLIKPDRYVKEISKSGISNQEIEAVLGGNAETLFGF